MEDVPLPSNRSKILVSSLFQPSPGPPTLKKEYMMPTAVLPISKEVSQRHISSQRKEEEEERSINLRIVAVQKNFQNKVNCINRIDTEGWQVRIAGLLELFDACNKVSQRVHNMPNFAI